MPPLAPDPTDLARMGIPPADWPFYQVASAEGPSAPIPEASASQLEALAVTLIRDLGIPAALAIPMAVELFTSEGGVPGTTAQPVSPAEAIASNPPASVESGGLEGPAPGTRAGPPGFGTMTADQRSALSGLGLGVKGVGLAGTLTGFAPAAAVGTLATPIAAVSIADLIARMSGVPGYAPDPFAGELSPTDIQGIKDTFGDFAAQDAAARNEGIRQSAFASFDTMPGGGPSGFSPDPGSYGEDPGRTSGDLGPGDGRDAGAAGDAGTGTGAESGSGYVAKGGAFTLDKPTRFVAGEAGREEAIFVPKGMDAPGMQPNEAAVRRALAASLLRLMVSDADLSAYHGRL